MRTISDAGTRTATASNDAKRAVRSAPMMKTAGFAIPPFSRELKTSQALTTCLSVSHKMAKDKLIWRRKASDTSGASTEIATRVAPAARISSS